MISVNCTQIIKKHKNVWSNIVFHPTDAIEDAWGQRNLDAIAADNAVKAVRIYAMTEDIVTQDASGKLHFDFSLNDLRLDYLTKKGFDIVLSYAFIPPFLAKDKNRLGSVAKNKTRYKGKMIVRSVPYDYSVWEEICYRYTLHIVERYGLEAVKKWYLQCLNEPDITLFFMPDCDDLSTRVREYMNHYRAFVSGVRRVDGNLTVGGPALALETDFLELFLESVKKENLPFDFFSGHTYGTSPQELNDGSKPFNAKNTLVKHMRFTECVRRYFPDAKIIIDEWGAASCGFYNIEECPKLIFRETSAYAAYFGKLIAEYINANAEIDMLMICLSGQHEMTVDFSGFRNFFTLNFIKKPIYNAHILANRLRENILSSESTHDGLSVLATSDDLGNMAVMLAYASENFDETMPEIRDTVHLENIQGDKNIRVWCIDKTHTDPYALFERTGMNEELTEEEISLLRDEGIMKPVLETKTTADGCLDIPVSFTDDALLLIEVN